MNRVLSSILNLLIIRPKPKKHINVPHRPVHCSSTASFVGDDIIHETDNNIPPTNDIPLDSIGSYCIKASVDLVNNTNSETVYNIVGYDVDLNIQNKVSKICNSYRAGDETLICMNEKLVFLGPKKKCDGNVTVTDVATNQEFFF